MRRNTLILTIASLATSLPALVSAQGGRMTAAVRPGWLGIRCEVTVDVREGRRTVSREIAVPTVSLGDLLDRHGAPERIDYISVDTEGAERAILEAFDFSRRRVLLWTVEHNFTPERAAVHALMERHGNVRRFPEFSRFDDWYAHRDLAG